MVERCELLRNKEITRREALLSIESGNKVICQMDGKEISEISTMQELQKVVNLEQRKICNELKFYK